MTTARSADEWVESLSVTNIKARSADEWVEALSATNIKARAADEWIEVIVGGAASGWAVGFIRMS